MGMRVAVAGASGYAGGELLRLIAGHPDLDLAVVTAESSAGKRVAELHPNLTGLPQLGERVFEPHSAVAGAGCELVFLSLPAGHSAPVAGQIPDEVKVIDLGPDFRLADPAAWTRHYDGEHAGRWITGIAELPGARKPITRATRVAAPGCYATASILALVPLVAAGLVDPADVVVVAASGTSGAGRSPRTDLLGSEVMGSVSAYAAGGAHRHTPEIEQALAETARTAPVFGTASTARTAPMASTARAAEAAEAGETGKAARTVRVSFTPVLAPMPRGILATCTAPLISPEISTADLRAALAAAYDTEPFVHLLPAGRWPATASVAGSNGAHVQAAADQRAGRATVITAIDNLGKGAAGQAIQLANLMLGLPETAGLTALGVAP